MYACMKAKEETVFWLLKEGADIKLQNNEGKTAGDLASERGFSRALELIYAEMPQIVSLLIEAGAESRY